MTKHPRHRGYWLALIAFTIINGAILWFINDNQAAFIRVLNRLNWITVIILALGIWRLTDIIVYEEVTEPVRELFTEEAVVNGKSVARIPESGFRGFFGRLLTCNDCTGVWVSMLVFYAFIFFSTATTIFMLIMALTGFERFFSKIFNVLEKKG